MALTGRTYLPVSDDRARRDAARCTIMLISIFAGRFLPPAPPRGYAVPSYRELPPSSSFRNFESKTLEVGTFVLWEKLSFAGFRSDESFEEKKSVDHRDKERTRLRINFFSPPIPFDTAKSTLIIVFFCVR